MPESVKVLGQSAPAANADVALYTVPANTRAVASSLFAANRGATDALIRVAVRVAGAALSNPQYVYYDVPVPANSTFASTTGISLGAGDIVSVRASTANVSFNLMGAEIT